MISTPPTKKKKGNTQREREKTRGNKRREAL
jgi:hypothetical protein